MSASEIPKPLTMRTRGSAASGIALTFDDGPCQRTAEILDVLDARGAKGTFFVVGKAIAGHEPLLRRMTSGGHEVANHSFQHAAYPREDDLEATSELIRSITGARPSLFRPPFGAADGETARAAARIGMTGIRWDVDSRDVFPVERGIEPEELLANVLGGTRPGSIVLMHDGCPWSSVAEALPGIVETLQERRYELVTVSEVLDSADGRPAASPRAHRGDSWLEHLDGLRPRQVVALLAGRESGPELAVALAERVASNPVPFSRLGGELARLDSSLVAAAIAGLRRALNLRRRYDWSGALDLVEAGLRAPSAGAGAEALALLADGWALDALPSELDQRAWAAVAGAGEGDAETRQQRVRAAIACAQRDDRGDARLEGRVGALLDRSLDPADADSSLVRGVVGAALPTLLELDRDWATARLDVIFGSDGAPGPPGDAAWDAFLLWTEPTPEIFELLEGRYRRSVESMADRATAPKHSAQDSGALGRHLFGLYRLGLIDLSPGGLVYGLGQPQAPATLAAIVETAGIELDRTPAATLGDRDRAGLMALWEWITARSEGWPEPQRALVSAPFGLWYASGKLDQRWSDAELLALLRAGIAVEPAFRVVARVARQARVNAGGAAEIASAWVQGVGDGWRLYVSRDDLAAIVDLAGAAGDPPARRRAEALARVLRERGWPSFEHLVAP